VGKILATTTDPAGMPHEELQGLIPAYAFGATDAVETRQVAEHLERCGECRGLLASYCALSDDLLYAMPGSFAPAGAGAGLARKLAGNGRAAPRASLWERLGMRLAWPLVAVALLALVLTNIYWSGRIGRLEERVAAQVEAVNAASPAPAGVLYADDEASHAAGVVYAPDGVGWVLLCVYDMPALPEGMAYQVWLIRDGERDSGGLFRVSPKGYGLLLMELTQPLAEYEGMGVTIEPATGSPGPTSPRVIGGRL
jgi:anti-sigma-K factor RskA